jgi:hypothetical protein
LPGAILHAVPVRSKTAATNTIDLTSLGVKGNGSGSKKKAGGNNSSKDPKTLTLRKSGLRGDDMGDLRIAVQVTTEAQSVVGAPPTGEFAVWALVANIARVMESSEETVSTEEVIICALYMA